MRERTRIQRQREKATSLTPIQSDAMQCSSAVPQQTVDEVPPIVQEVLSSSGQPLDTETRSFMEPRFGHDFSKVRVHTDERAVESAQAVNALAYTVGQDVVFGEGQYEPETSEGKRLLAHELTHVVQHKPDPLVGTHTASNISFADPTDGSEQIADQVAVSLRTGSQDPSSLLALQHNQISIHRPVLHRKNKEGTVDITEPEKVEAGSPEEINRNFSHATVLIQHECDIALLTLSEQFGSAMTDFQLWYKKKPSADASLFNSIVNVIMNTAWAWGEVSVGKAVAPIGSAIQLIAQISANLIKASEDDFADSLLQCANNFKSTILEQLIGKVPQKIQEYDEKMNTILWQELLRRAYLGQEWQSLLYQYGGLPRPGVNYRMLLLSEMIFKYEQWELLAKHSPAYIGYYKNEDPYLQHLANRAEAEAYIAIGKPIPKRLKSYARQGEHVEGD